MGFEPTYNGFANRCLTTWLPHRTLPRSRSVHPGGFLVKGADLSYEEVMRIALGADENLFAQTLAYHERDLEEELKLIELTRTQMARILRTLPVAALERVGVHNERGPLTLEKLLTGATNHITHHVKFIHEKRKALGV